MKYFIKIKQELTREACLEIECDSLEEAKQIASSTDPNEINWEWEGSDMVFDCDNETKM
jgi:hypothetical protein